MDLVQYGMAGGLFFAGGEELYARDQGRVPCGRRWLEGLYQGQRR